MAIDYGNDYATILPGGRLILDLSPTRITGPKVPLVRVVRAWLDGPLAGAIERTWTPIQISAMAARLRVIAEQVEHVLRAETSFALGPSKHFVARGQITVGGSQTYPLIVEIGDLTAAIVSIGA